MIENRFVRQIQMFGIEGQNKLQDLKVAVMGAGGLGSIVIPQIALLGVGNITVIDNEEIELSNRNRYFGVWHDDPIPGSSKVELAKRLIKNIDPNLKAMSIHKNILSSKGIDVIKNSDYILGCVDNDGVRFFLNAVCQAYCKPLIDMASEVKEEEYGGRIKIVDGSSGCLYCQDLLDEFEVRRFYSSKEMQEIEDKSYGVNRQAIDTSGPSVVSLNGTVASLGVTALLALVTDSKINYNCQYYYGKKGIVTNVSYKVNENCKFCNEIRGQKDNADIYKYIPNLEDNN